MVDDPETGKESYDGLNFHDLRKNTGTGLVAAGIDPKTVQEFLGHADIRTTLEIYAQGVPELGKQATAAMGRKFMTPPPRDERAMDGEQADEDTDDQTRRKAP